MNLLLRTVVLLLPLAGVIVGQSMPQHHADMLMVQDSQLQAPEGMSADSGGEDYADEMSDSMEDSSFEVEHDKDDEGKFFTITGPNIGDIQWDLFKEPTTRRPPRPTRRPTRRPTHRPTHPPTAAPTNAPTDAPTTTPTGEPNRRVPWGYPYRYTYPQRWPQRQPYPYWTGPYYRPVRYPGMQPYRYPPGPPRRYWPQRGRPMRRKNTKNRTTNKPQQDETQQPVSVVQQTPIYANPLPIITAPIQQSPIYTTLGGGQVPFTAVSPNVAHNPPINSLSATSNPLQVSTSVVGGVPVSLSLSTHLSSSNSGDTITVPQANTNQLTRIGEIKPESPAPAAASRPTKNKVSTTSTVVTSTPTKIPTTNQNFCKMFGWICDSNSKVEIAQMENSDATKTPYVVLLVQAPTPTQVTYLKSAE